MITIYADVLFIVNFIINILILEGTALIIHKETKIFKILLGACLGGIFAVAVFFVELNVFLSLIFRLLMSWVIVYAAFNNKTLKGFLKVWGSFYLVSFIFGGVTLCVFSMTDLGYRLGGIYSNGAIYFSLPWQILLLSGSGAYCLISVFSKIRRMKLAEKRAESTLTVFIKERKLQIKAIMDTGNTLTDPISGMPVIVVEYDQVKALLPKEGTLTDKMINADLKIRMIPFSSVGCEKSVMVGFLPDEVFIDNQKTDKCIIGISETKLSSDAQYHALLNPMLVMAERL